MRQSFYRLPGAAVHYFESLTAEQLDNQLFSLNVMIRQSVELDVRK